MREMTVTNPDGRKVRTISDPAGGLAFAVGQLGESVTLSVYSDVGDGVQLLREFEMTGAGANKLGLALVQAGRRG